MMQKKWIKGHTTNHKAKGKKETRKTQERLKKKERLRKTKKKGKGKKEK